MYSYRAFLNLNEKIITVYSTLAIVKLVTIVFQANKTATDAISLKEKGLTAQKSVNAVCADVPNINDRIYRKFAGGISHIAG